MYIFLTVFYLDLFFFMCLAVLLIYPKMLDCELFAVYVLCLTTLWVYLGRSLDFHTLALAMFFPALFAIYFANEGFFTVVFGKNQVRCILVSLGVFVWNFTKLYLD